MPTKFSLTFQQKQALYDEFKRRQHEADDTSQEALSQWAKDKFALGVAPHQSTISRILASQKTIPIPRSAFINKRDRTGKHHRLEEVLYGWVCDQYVLRRCITGSMIRFKATTLLESINEKLPETSRISMTFSGGWLTRFQDRWGLKSRATRGECGDADYEGIEREVPKIKETIKNYDLEDIWNADEFGLNYSMAPSRTISAKQLAGRKKEKKRISCLACCNATGTEKFPLMFIGKAFRPHCFKGKTGKDLGYDYYNNSKAWMTASFFFEWLHRLDDYIGKKEGCRIVLLIDNCSAHGTEESIPQLRFVHVVFLPPNTTSQIQPLDAGIIASMKVQYRKKQMERALDMIDVNAKDIYKLDQLTGMKWITDVWDGIPINTIANCWKNTGLIHEKLPPGLGKVELVEMKKDITDLEDMINELVPVRDRMGIQQFINPVGEQESTEEVTNDGMIQAVVQACTDLGNSEPQNIMIDGEESEVLPTLKEEIRALAVVKLVIDRDYQDEKSLLRGLVRIQKELRVKQRRSAKQTRIDSFFGRN